MKPVEFCGDARDFCRKSRSQIQIQNLKSKRNVVEAAGIEPASKGCDQRDLHVYFVHLNFAVREQMNKQDLTIS